MEIYDLKEKKEYLDEVARLEYEEWADNKEENSVIKGKGYYKNEDNQIIVFFSSDDIKYKYICNEETLTILCNDSKYEFKENIKKEGKIKNGDYIFKITTLASKIEVCTNYIIVNYSLFQNDIVIGTYYSKLSFN